MDVAQKTREAYAELDEFIELLDESDKNKIPSNVRAFFKNEKDKNYINHIDREIPIDKQNLREETLALIALLYLRYICTDEKEKDRLRNIYNENERKYQEYIKEKYDPEKALERKNEQTNNSDEKIEDGVDKATEEKALVIHKESLIKRIINKIKKFLKR